MFIAALFTVATQAPISRWMDTKKLVVQPIDTDNSVVMALGKAGQGLGGDGQSRGEWERL